MGIVRHTVPLLGRTMSSFSSFAKHTNMIVAAHQPPLLAPRHRSLTTAIHRNQPWDVYGAHLGQRDQ